MRSPSPRQSSWKIPGSRSTLHVPASRGPGSQTTQGRRPCRRRPETPYGSPCSGLMVQPAPSLTSMGHYPGEVHRSEEHTSELQSLMRISYAVFCLKNKKHKHSISYTTLQ